ncbi:MAG: patatin-like phospholipase family protein [Verrucomicrobiota bacterium]
MRVLIVDDSDTKIAAVTAVFEGIAGFDIASVAIAKSAIAAKRLMRSEQFELMILDVRLPKRDGDVPTSNGGCELIDAIRSSRRYRVPKYVIGLTAYSASESIVEAFARLTSVVLQFSKWENGWRKKLQDRVELILHDAEGAYADHVSEKVVALHVDSEESYQETCIKKKLALVMKGGGVKGLAYIGAIEELDKKYKFDWFVGTSAGAITAILLGAGYTTDELKIILRGKNFKEFFDASWYSACSNLVFHHGFYKAQSFTDWMDDLLATKLGSANRVKLSDLKHRVTVFASRRGSAFLKFDSVDNDCDAAYAARCSMSIPVVFTPQTDQGIRAYDGGLQHNYPIEALKKDYPHLDFVSLYLGPEIYRPIKQNWVILDLLSIWTEASDPESISKYRDKTVIIDPNPIGTLDFGLTEFEKEFLLAVGRLGAARHLNLPSEIELRRYCVELRGKVIKSRKSNRVVRWAKRLGTVAIGLACAMFLIFRGEADNAKDGTLKPDSGAIPAINTSQAFAQQEAEVAKIREELEALKKSGSVEMASEDEKKKIAEIDVMDIYRNRDREFTVILDAGHGGLDNGRSVSESLEKDLTLGMALRLKEFLKSADIRVILTRDADVFVPLWNRALQTLYYPNAILISLHCDLETADGQRGAAIFYNKNGVDFAKRIQSAVTESRVTPIRDFEERSYAILRDTTHPGVMLDLGVSNQVDIHVLLDPQLSDRLLEAVAVGINDYMKAQ